MLNPILWFKITFNWQTKFLSEILRHNSNALHQLWPEPSDNTLPRWLPWQEKLQASSSNVLILIHVVSGFVRTNSLPDNQSVCLNLWVSIPPVIMKSQSNMEIYYYLVNKDGTIQKQQVNKQQRAWSQSGRQHMVNLWTWQGLN